MNTFTIILEALATIETDGDLSEEHLVATKEVIACLEAEAQALSSEDMQREMAWLEQCGGFRQVFGVGGLFSRCLVDWRGDAAPYPLRKVMARELRVALEAYVSEGRNLGALAFTFRRGWEFLDMDVEARKRSRRSLSELLDAAKTGEESAVLRLIALSPQSAHDFAPVQRFVDAKRAAGDKKFLRKYRMAQRGRLTDRRASRPREPAADEQIENFLLYGAAIIQKGPWSDVDLLSFLQDQGIVAYPSTRFEDRQWFKVRRQRLRVSLSRKGHQPRPKAVRGEEPGGSGGD